MDVDLGDKPKWWVHPTVRSIAILALIIRLLDANPAGLVPVLAVGKPPIYLTESADIVQFIVSATPHLDAPNDVQRAEAVAFARTALGLLEADLLPDGSSHNPAKSALSHARQLGAIRRVQEFLHPVGPYALGERYTIADILIAPFVGRLWFYGKHDIAPAGIKTVQTLQEDSAFSRYLGYTRAILSRKSWIETWDEDYSIGRLKDKMRRQQIGQIGQAPK